MKFLSAKDQLDLFLRGAANLTPIPDLLKKLSENRPLIVKLGADPTAPDLHLGHAVVLEKMRQFQSLGHQVVFLIGDFTAKIGDPTGRSKIRPALSEEEIKVNAKTYMDQVGRILDLSTLKLMFNSQIWNELSARDVVKILSRSTLAQVLAREDFSNRMSSGVPVRFDELFYPMMQGYDSVAMKTDVELGGTDQTFNLLFGRHLQEQFNQEPQVVLTMPILEGLDGVQKMSKSLGNYVGLSEPAESAFVKLMSIPDSVVPNYGRLLLSWPELQVDDFKAGISSGSLHPMVAKKEVALAIVSKFWSQEQASSAIGQFERIVQEKDYSAIPEVFFKAGQLADPCWIVDLLRAIEVVQTSSEAKRLLEAGAVEIDGRVILDFKAKVEPKGSIVVVVGKKFAKRLIFS